ncbi:phosphoribosylanthranilate isomerase [Rhizobiales bacterium]|uniref:phosphoribosylanthranilate isomerase n=1 Tax=Hongsoonwoonella zoysiae TaxID=2821844 RepID=UPI001560CEC0|nr:phosphoribosylanthranilate isomerase [Hongsoonwoonella zoysiae]NRG16804.1 phosphoribosylanthranilate isomerase [Hongsoonwoonella zoysiae]
MTDPLVKICGLSTPETLDAALDAGAAMVGLVFFPKSPRNISIENASRLAERARGRAEIVALMVDPDDGLIDEVVERVKPDWLQLHGKETPERCARIKMRTGLKLMKALGVSEGSDIDAAMPYIGIVDRFLFDAKPPKGGEVPGGNGIAYDWSLLKELDLGVPVMLSGGLAPDTIAEALAISGVSAVDVSSGVERERGVKDENLIRAFIANAKRAGVGE